LPNFPEAILSKQLPFFIKKGMNLSRNQWFVSKNNLLQT